MTTAKYPSFFSNNLRKPVAGVDFDPDGVFDQDEYEYLTGTGRYTDNDKIEKIEVWYSGKRGVSIVFYRNNHTRHGYKADSVLRFKRLAWMLATGRLVCGENKVKKPGHLARTEYLID